MKKVLKSRIASIFFIILLILNLFGLKNYDKYKLSSEFKKIQKSEDSSELSEKKKLKYDYEKLEKMSDSEKEFFHNSLKVDLNKALIEDLIDVKGIGATTAEKIIEYREKNGYFLSVSELKNISGIGGTKYEVIAENVTVELNDKMLKLKKQKEVRDEINKLVDINNDDIEKISLLKGIGRTTAQYIIDYRETHKGFKKAEELLKVKRISEDKFYEFEDKICLKKYKKKKKNFDGNKLDINTITYIELRKLPYITPGVGKLIIKYRQKNQGFEKIKELKNIKGISYTRYVKIKKYFYIK